MPTDAELKAYAQSLPDIYRDIMAAFPEIEPNRKAGNGLAFQTLAIYFANTRKGHSLPEVQEACTTLAANGFLEIKDDIFAHPTDLGEKLIAAVTDKPRASSSSVPKLPTRLW
jgi:hypothetical protein